MAATILPAVIMPRDVPGYVHLHGAHGGQYALRRERDRPAGSTNSTTGGPDISLPMIGDKGRTI